MIDFGPYPTIVDIRTAFQVQSVSEVRDAFRAQKAEAARRRGAAKAKAKRQAEKNP